MVEDNKKQLPAEESDLDLEIADDVQQQPTKGDTDFLETIDVVDKSKKQPNPLEQRLVKDGWQKVDKHYEKKDVHYTVRVSSEPGKARIVFGYDLLGQTLDKELHLSIYQKITGDFKVRSMPRVPKAGNVAVGFSMKYQKPEDLFTMAEQISGAIGRHIADHLHKPIAQIKYIDANTAHTMQMEYQEQQMEKKK